MSTNDADMNPVTQTPGTAPPPVPNGNGVNAPFVDRYGWGYTTPGAYNPPNAFYTEVPLPLDAIPYIGIIIGKAGYYFKAITKASRAKYIWFNPLRGVVEVWGSERSLPHACRRVIQRIALVMNQIKAKEVLAAMGESPYVPSPPPPPPSASGQAMESSDEYEMVA